MSSSNSANISEALTQALDSLDQQLPPVKADKPEDTHLTAEQFDTLISSW